MSRRSVAYKRGYEHADFSELLNELRGDTDQNSCDENDEIQAMDLSAAELNGSVESVNRHRIMSNPKIKPELFMRF